MGRASRVLWLCVAMSGCQAPLEGGLSADDAGVQSDVGVSPEDVADEPERDDPDEPDIGGDVQVETDTGEPGHRCGWADGQIFPPSAPFNRPVGDVPADPESDAIIAYLEENHDTNTRFQIDFSILTLSADEETASRPFEPTEDHYEVECDTAPVPVPEGGALEGEAGYECENDGDCHLIVMDEASCRLYEMWRADIGDVFRGGCLAVWSTDRVYGAEGRGDQCTSADAAGLPIAPLLFGADEVASGEIKHAIRFILPNIHIRNRVYVRPATHSTGATGGGAQSPPYGARLRLRDDVDISALAPAAQVVARALRDYGMILADAGNLTFTAASDRVGEATWDSVGLGPHDLKGLRWRDFEVVDGGERVSYTGDCVREPITD